MAQADPVSTFTCPNGHASTSSDYCDTCGVPIPASAAARAPPDAVLRAAAPRRGADPRDRRNAPAAARRDHRRDRALPRRAGVPQLRLASRRRGAVLRGLRLRLHHRHDAAPARPVDRRGCRGRRRRRRDPAPLAPAIAVDWVAEVWVDPDWYEAQESDDPCPSPGLPAVVELTAKSVLVGRPSTSRNIHPEIDCTGDPG